MFIMTCPRANVNGVHGARICLRCAYIADMRACCRVHFVSAAMFIPLMLCVHTSVFTSLAPHAPLRLPRKHACIHPRSQHECHHAYLANARASIRIPSVNAACAAALTSQTCLHPSSFPAQAPRAPPRTVQYRPYKKQPPLVAIEGRPPGLRPLSCGLKAHHLRYLLFT